MIKDSIIIEDIEIQKGGRASIKRYTKKKNKKLEASNAIEIYLHLEPYKTL